MNLSLEESYLLECAKLRGYVTSDVRDEYDPVVEAYRDWCRTERLPFLHLALGDATSQVIFSLLEADSVFGATTEEWLREQIPQFCLCNADIELEDDYLIARRVENVLLPALQDWLLQLSHEMILAGVKPIG